VLPSVVLFKKKKTKTKTKTKKLAATASKTELRLQRQSVSRKDQSNPLDGRTNDEKRKKKVFEVRVADVRSYQSSSACSYDGLFVLFRHFCGDRAVTETLSAISPNHHARSLILFAQCERQHGGCPRVDVVLIDQSVGLIDAIFRKKIFVLAAELRSEICAHT
jgi:hypothetical protein